MRISNGLVLPVVAFVMLAGACSDDGGGGGLAAFCEVHTDPEFENLDPSNEAEGEKMSEAMAKMADNAPEEIKEDAETTRAGFEVVSSGDVEEIGSLDVEEFEAAANRVQEYAEEHCT